VEKLDFSGISTEKLRFACNEYNLHKGISCRSVNCIHDACPLNIESFCSGDMVQYKDVNKLFKEELNRREKDMNEMPELKAGMVVELDTLNTGVRHCVLIPCNGQLELITPSFNRFGILNLGEILKIYTNPLSHLAPLDDNEVEKRLDLIWSRKSENDIKIEELKKTVKEALKQIEELKA